MTTHSSDMPICEQSFYSDSTLLNFILFSQFMQDNDEKRIDDGNSSEPGIHMFEEFNSAEEQERNTKRNLSDEPSFKLSDVYDVSFYERRMIDDGKSTSEPGIHMFTEFNSANEHENNTLKQSTVKYKKCTTNQNETSDKGEMFTSTSNDYGSSGVSADYKVSAKKKKNQKSKNNRHLKQAAVKCKKYTAHKNELSDEEKMSSSGSSDKYEMPSPNSSVDWEMPSSESSDGEETSSNSSDKHSNTSNDSSDSSDDYGVSAKIKKKQKFKVSAKKEKNQKSKIVELSEYEKMIQKNRDEKIAFLQSLRMNEVKETLNEAIKNLKPKSCPRKNDKSSKSGLNPHDPPRKSLRLAKRNAEVKKELPPILTFKKAFIEDNVYTDFVYDFDDPDFIASKPITDYVSCFTNMKIDESKIAKVVKGNITTIAFHPMKEKIIVSAGNMYGSISFWHLNSGYDPYQFKPHYNEVSCLKFNSDFPNQIISCSYDGTMRCGDLEKKNFTQVFKSDKTGCNYFDFVSPSSIIVCLRNGNVSLVDIRADSKYLEMSHNCHESPVMSVSVHPLNKNYFVSVDRKGFISLWDLRDLQKAVIVMHRHRTLLRSAFFSPISGNSILVSSPFDDTLCLYDCSKLGNHLSLSKKISYKFGSSKLKATWLPNTDEAFVIGSLESPKRIKIFDNQLDNIYNFQDPSLNSIAYVSVFHPSLPVLGGGNSSGKVFIFS